MIKFHQVSLQYGDANTPTLREVNLEIPEGELVLVTGRTGSGKSTLLGLINGLVPHFTGGTLSGEVLVNGHSTALHPPRDLAHIVGVVSQDPLAGFVTDTVEEELAYSMEQLSIPQDVMRKRVEETLDLLGIADLRDRPLMALSGGQQQRVAIGAALTAHPRVLVLDEPTSSLDPTAAEEVLSAITRLVHDLGLTVVIAEHRLERIVQYVDFMLHLAGDGTVTSGSPVDVLHQSDLAPPIVHLSRALGWADVPLSVRDARRSASDLRSRLITAAAPTDSTPSTGDVVMTAQDLVVRHGSVLAVDHVDLTLRQQQIVALMGRNGSGKSSLLWALQGSGRRQGGHVTMRSLDSEVDPIALSPSDARQLVGLVPQTPTDLLYLSTVQAECDQADRDADQPPGTCQQLLDTLSPGIARDAHPRDLSEGQKLSLVLAIQLTAKPPVILLDEPTRGLDYHAKQALTKTLQELSSQGHSIVVSTHDVEFVATTADRVVVLADGEVIADGDIRSVVVASPAFAPQVAKVLAPVDALTVDEVVALVNDLSDFNSRADS